MAVSKRSERSHNLDKLLFWLVLAPWLFGRAHRLMELCSARYRALNARAFQDRAALDRAIEYLDRLAQFEPLRTGSSTGMGKDLTGVAFEPGLEASGSYTRLHKADLRSVVMSSATFHQMNFRKTIWKDAVVSDSVFTACNFQQAFLTPEWTNGTKFSDCRFASATLAGNFDGATFEDSALDGHHLGHCSFRGAVFRRCALREADLEGVDLEGAEFQECDLTDASFTAAALRGARFQRCVLHGASWSEADIEGVSVERSAIYGMSLWGTRGAPAAARALTVTKPDEETSLEIDGLHIAVFVLSLLEGNGVRELVDGLSSTLVLVLGRFDGANKQVLDAIRRRLRDLGYSAIVFDSAAPRQRDTSETVSILAKLSHFVIADLTTPRSAPYELQLFASDSGTPLQIVTRGEPPFSMAHDLEKYSWVLPSREFADATALLAALPELVTDLERFHDRPSSTEPSPQPKQIE